MKLYTEQEDRKRICDAALYVYLVSKIVGGMI